MEVDEMENDFKWIHPETVLIDHKLFTLYFRHISASINLVPVK